MMKSYITIFLIALSAFFFVSCAQAKQAAMQDLYRARAQEEQLKNNDIPEDMQQNFRIQLKQAENAYNEKDYKNSQKYSNSAIVYAETTIAEYEKLRADLDLRLKNIFQIITTEAFPRQVIVKAYFDAEEAVAKKEYRTASEIIAKAERTQRLEGAVTKRLNLVISADEEFYKKYKFIPVYEKVLDNSLAGDIILKLYEDYEAKFISSVWKNRDVRLVNISIRSDEGLVTGWVEGRFVH